MFAAVLLPDKDDLALDDCLMEDRLKTIPLFVSCPQPNSACPTCQALSDHIHSHYRRTLLDLPCADYTVYLCWTVRRFFCDNPLCKRLTFAEGLPAVVTRYGRKTERRLQKQEAIAFEVGGEPGRRIVTISGLGRASIHGG